MLPQKNLPSSPLVDEEEDKESETKVDTPLSVVGTPKKNPAIAAIDRLLFYSQAHLMRQIVQWQRPNRRRYFFYIRSIFYTKYCETDFVIKPRCDSFLELGRGRKTRTTTCSPCWRKNGKGVGISEVDCSSARGRAWKAEARAQRTPGKTKGCIRRESNPNADEVQSNAIPINTGGQVQRPDDVSF